MGEWISRYDRLPENGQLILFTSKYIDWDGTVSRKIYLDRFSEWEFKNMRGVLSRMSAWMPAPDPYIEGEDEYIPQ